MYTDTIKTRQHRAKKANEIPLVSIFKKKNWDAKNIWKQGTHIALDIHSGKNSEILNLFATNTHSLFWRQRISLLLWKECVRVRAWYVCVCGGESGWGGGGSWRMIVSAKRWVFFGWHLACVVREREFVSVVSVRVCVWRWWGGGVLGDDDFCKAMSFLWVAPGVCLCVWKFTNMVSVYVCVCVCVCVCVEEGGSWGMIVSARLFFVCAWKSLWVWSVCVCVLGGKFLDWWLLLLLVKVV